MLQRVAKHKHRNLKGSLLGFANLLITPIFIMYFLGAVLAKITDPGPTRSRGCVFDLNISGSTLVVPRDDGKRVLFYDLF